MAKSFQASAVTERKLATELRKVARIVSGIINSHVDGSSIRDPQKLAQALAAYSEALGPWAEKIVAVSLASVAKRNATSFGSASSLVGRELRGMLADSTVGGIARLLQNRQVGLIKSIPLEAGLRAQKLAQEAAAGGRRAAEVAVELAATEKVTVNRATLIARTEIAKANAAITQARAQHVGATHYIWRTAGDADVRESHAEMDGKVFRFDDPPHVEGEGNHGPGEFPNCRCYAEPVIPE